MSNADLMHVCDRLEDEAEIVSNVHHIHHSEFPLLVMLLHLLHPRTKTTSWEIGHLEIDHFVAFVCCIVVKHRFQPDHKLVVEPLEPSNLPLESSWNSNLWLT